MRANADMICTHCGADAADTADAAAPRFNSIKYYEEEEGSRGLPSTEKGCIQLDASTVCTSIDRKLVMTNPDKHWTLACRQSFLLLPLSFATHPPPKTSACAVVPLPLLTVACIVDIHKQRASSLYDSY